MKKFLVPAIFTIAIILVLFFAIRALVNPSNDASPEDTAEPTPAALTEQQQAQLREGQKTGSEQARVVLTAFGDFECPACKVYEPTLQELRGKYSEQLQVIWKHFPLYPQPHKNARLAAYASEAAANQGRFWEMHDKLYETQEAWASLSDPKSKFSDYARELGLDVGRFSEDLNNEAGKDNVDRDLALARELKLGGTPSFFINGEAFDTSNGAAQLKKQIEDLISGATSGDQQ